MEEIRKKKMEKKKYSRTKENRGLDSAQTRGRKNKKMEKLKF